MSTSTSIQLLLEAEKEAGKIVAKSRQYRIQRLKDARSEAIKEIEAIKAQKNAEFAQFEAQFSGSNSESTTKVNAETVEKLASNNALFLKNKQLVLDKLLAAVALVEPQIHPNVSRAK